MFLSNIRKYFIYALFVIPSLSFCVDYTRNPYVIQGVLLFTIVAVIWITWGLEALKQGKIILKKLSIVDIALLIFWVFTLMTWGIAFIKFPEYSVAIYGEGLRRFLLFTINGILIYFIARYFIKTNEILYKVLSFLFFAALVSSVYGILQYLGIELIWTRTMLPFGTRCVTTFGNPNFFSSYLILIIPLAVYKIIYNRYAYSRFIWFLFSLCLVIALVATGTRSSWLAFLVIAALIILYHLKVLLAKFKYLWKKAVLVLLIIIAILWFSPMKKAVTSRVKETLDINYRNKGIYQRLMVWSSARDMFLDNPVSGVGWGIFEMFFPFYQGKYLETVESANYRTHANNTHNEILEIVTQVGIVGFGIYIWFYVCFFLFSRVTLDTKDKSKRDSVFILAAIIGMFVDNMLNVSMHFAIPMLIFWFLMGVQVNKAEWTTNSYDDTKEFNLNYIGKILIVLFIIFLLSASLYRVRRFRSDVMHFKGLDAIKGGQRINTTYLNTALKYFIKSYNLNKFNVNNNYEIGNAYSRMGMNDKARHYYAEAIKYMPGYDEIYYNLGVMHFNNKEVDRAVELFEVAYSMHPLSKDILSLMGHIFIREEKTYERAFEVLFKLAKTMQADYIAYNNLGFLYSLRGDFENALLNYNKARSLNALGIIVQNINLANSKKSGVPIIIYNFKTQVGKSG